MKLFEIKLKKLSWAKPNFEHEWETEAKNYVGQPGAAKAFWLDKPTYLELMHKGSEADLKRSVIKQLDNHMHTKKDWELLDTHKKERVEQAFARGHVEMPIVLNFGNGKLYLLGGNTRLNHAQHNGYEAKVWLVNMPK